MKKPSPFDRVSAARVEHSLYPGSRWRHVKSDNVYRVFATGLNEADLVPMVAYTSTDPAQMNDIWFRPVSEFVERFELVSV